MATRTTTWLRLCVALPCVLGSGGCAAVGGQTGEEQEPCWSKRTPLALDAESPLGFSPRDSLNLAAGEQTAALHWIPSARYPYGPESGDGELRVAIRGLGTAHFATRDEPTVAPAVEPACPPSVLTDVEVEFDTAGGAFRERFRGVLVASQEQAATLSATLLGGRLAGAFAFESSALAGKSLAQVTLSSSFGAGSFSGAVTAGIEEAHGDGANSAVSLENVPLACWRSATAAGALGCAE